MIVFSKLPTAGLGNMLFVWARGLVYAKNENASFYHSSWKKVKFKSFLKTGRLLRYYTFFERKNQISGIYLFFLRIKYKGRIVYEPAYDSKIHPFAEFNQIPHWADYFKGLKGNEEYLLDQLCKITKPEYLKFVEEATKPVVGIHIRMGDFKKLLPNQNFKEYGGVRTPFDYFINIIKQIRVIKGSKVPVTIFSDGTKEDFTEIFTLENVELARTPNEITDLLLLSKAKIIITSAGSTFGYWAGFLSNAAIIMHPDHMHQSIRSKEKNKNLFEGPFDSSNPVLINKIKAL